MGTSVIGGMLTATCIAIFIIPAMFYLMEKLTHRKKKDQRGHETSRIGVLEGRD